jgi:hypothetical protein
MLKCANNSKKTSRCLLVAIVVQFWVVGIETGGFVLILEQMRTGIDPMHHLVSIVITAMQIADLGEFFSSCFFVISSLIFLIRQITSTVTPGFRTTCILHQPRRRSTLAQSACAIATCPSIIG